ncbi:MAG: CRTAC1 family protein [Acidobacteriota bacterium]|nr:CRTAC1 family protein [Acidobacteriota bacterium]
MTFSRRHLFSLPAGTLLSLRLRGASQPLFEEVSPAASGITWVHENAMSPQRYLPETMSPGCAFLDFDNDGWMDIYLVNSGPCDFYRPARPLRNALYRNNRDGTFTDVTEAAGVAGGTFGMGVAVGDYDNDGWPDLFVTSYGNCILYRNNRDGTFTDVTKRAGVETPGFTTSAVWFDYDNDGRLDLFVCSYVNYGKADHFLCDDGRSGMNYYCVPRLFKGTSSFLYHNNGDGTFTRVERGTDIASSSGKGLGVVATDINNDGWMDLFVANDSVQNFLFMNRGPERAQSHPGSPGVRTWRFEESALPAEVAFGQDGQARSGMGVDAADVFNSGYQDLFVANIDQEMFSLYRNMKDETFRDISREQGIGQLTRYLSGWGLKFFDYDNDGAVDLILANGHPDDRIETRTAQVKYKEPLLLFHQEAGKLRNVSADAGPAFSKSYAARGLAAGDFNNDGLIDILIGNNGGRPLLLRNVSNAGNHWLGLKLEGVRCNRDAIGAKIRWSAGGTVRSRLKNGGGSYLSSHDPREVLGVGNAAKIEWVEITWPKPSGRVQRIENPPLNRYLAVREA